MKPTTDDVLKWAREVGLTEELWMTPDKDLYIAVNFAALAYAAGAKAMQERCAKVCEGENDNSTQDFDPEILLWNTAIRLCAMKIRALGDDDD